MIRTNYQLSRFPAGRIKVWLKKLISLKAKALLIALSIVIIVTVATLTQITLDRQKTWERRQSSLMDVANVVDRHLSESIFQVNALVDVLAEQIIEVGNATEMAHPGKIQLMQAYCKSLVGCNAIGITDPTGLIVANSALQASPNIDVRDRAYYKAVTSTGLRFIGPAVVSRVPGNPILFHIARPVFDHAGKLKAVIVVGMETEGLAETYSLMDFALKPSIAIFKANGDVIATYPNMAKAVGENKSKTRLFQHFLVRSPSGVIESTEGDVDGEVVPKILAYKKMADFGLVVAVGLNYKSAFHDWRARTSSTLVVSILLLGLILVVLRYGYVAMKRQVTAEARNEHLQRLSYLDALTGISNRRRFDETIQHDWAMHRRTASPLCVLLIDIDHFKQFNDTLGHQQGDECLRLVAQALAKCVHRQSDLLARYGGEEFCAVLHCDEKGAMTVAERMCATIEMLKIAHPRSSASRFVTVSIGFAVVHGGRSHNLSADLVEEADRALYKAKAAGRNQVFCAATTSGQSLHLAMPEETSLPSIVIATPTGAYPIASAAWNNLGEAFFAKDVRHLRSLLCERRPTVLLANLTFDGGQFLPVISEAKRLGCTVLVVDCYATKFNAQELAVIRSVVEEMGADAWFDLRSTFDPTNPLGATKSMHDVIKNLIRCQQFKKLDTVESTSVPT